MINKPLKIARVREGLNQAEMAERLQISRVHYSSIETGRRRGTIDFFRRVQETFDLSDAETWQIAKGGL